MNGRDGRCGAPGGVFDEVWRVAVVPVSFGRDAYLRAHEACHANAKLWMLAVEWREGESPGKRDLQDFVVSLPAESRPVHAHTAQIVAHDLHEAVKTFRENRAQGRKVRAPWRTKNYGPLSFTAGYGWRVFDRTLFLSLGRSRPRLSVPLPMVRDSASDRFVAHCDWGEIQLCWDISARRFALHVPYRSRRPIPESRCGGVVAIDEGLINAMTLARQAEDGAYEVTVINGRAARAVKRRRNKATAAINRRLARAKPGSRRHRKLTLARKRNQARCQRRLRDFDHQVARKAANVIAAAGADRVVVGDVRGIEQKTRRKQRTSRSLRQQLSQWSRGRQERYLLEKTGLELEHIDEAYTSQTCLACGARNRPRGRNYRCRECGFSYHRDAVGAINILHRAAHGDLIAIDPATEIRVTYLRAVKHWSPDQAKTQARQARARSIAANPAPPPGGVTASRQPTHKPGAPRAGHPDPMVAAP